VYTEFEGNEFVIDLLHPGSIINLRAFLMEDLMFVNIRCRKDAIVLEMDFALINELNFEDDVLNRAILQYTGLLINKNKRYPLDYMISIPPILLDRSIS